MKRGTPILALFGVLMAGSALNAAHAESIIIFNTLHTLAFAEVACSLDREPAAVALCRSVDDPRRLGREFENQILSQFGVTTQCKGVTLARLLGPKDDGEFSQAAMDLMRKEHWSLHVDYSPVSERYEWALFAEPGFGSPDQRWVVRGEGTTAQIAQQVCNVVAGLGGTVPQ
jgi:hypothetical protein